MFAGSLSISLTAIYLFAIVKYVVDSFWLLKNNIQIFSVFLCLVFKTNKEFYFSFLDPTFDTGI